MASLTPDLAHSPGTHPDPERHQPAKIKWAESLTIRYLKQVVPLTVSLLFALSISAQPPKVEEPRSGLATSSASSQTRAATELERHLNEIGLVDIRSLDPTIACELKYTTPANFMGRDVYGPVDQCFLVGDAARRLAVANAHLRNHYPDLHLVVGDALRPRAVQRIMWSFVQGTPQQPYVANPSPGSMHNHGVAVDITVADSEGNRLDMGTPLDHFGPEAQVRLEPELRRKGVLSSEQLANRLILRETMTRAGFFQLQIEWWHFNAWDKSYVRGRFPIIEDFPAKRSN